MANGVMITRSVGFAIMVAALGVVSGRVEGQSSTGPDVVAEAVAHLPGREIVFRDAGGSGVPIVFLHAGTGSSIVWQHQIAAVRAAGYRFVAYDRLGSGRSVLDPRAEPGSAADDLQGLMDHLKTERFHLVGAKIGGTIARGFDRLGWHWWPAAHAIPSVETATQARCGRRGTCMFGCPEGAKGSTDLTIWPKALE